MVFPDLNLLQNNGKSEKRVFHFFRIWFHFLDRVIGMVTFFVFYGSIVTKHLQNHYLCPIKFN